MTYSVAVYGSLRQGLGNHRLLEHVTRFKKGLTIPEFIMYSLGGFPAIVPGPGGPVTVEVYEVDASTFRRLDGLEGYPNFYDRKVVEVQVEDGSVQEAWIYFMHEDNHYIGNEVVTSNDWLAYKDSY